VSKKKGSRASTPAEALAKAFTIEKAGTPSGNFPEGSSEPGGKFPQGKKEKPSP